MIKIVQISDLHISQNIHDNKHDCTPFQKLASVLDDIQKNHSDLSGLIITGDLSNDYTLESYINIKTLLKRYEFDMRILPGNHDDIDMIRNICDDQIRTSAFQYPNEDLLTYNCDTHIQDKARGFVRSSEIEELNEQLNSTKSRVLVFTHHPLVKINSKWIDRNMTENSNLLIQLMLRHSNKSFAVFSGHVHQEFYKKINNIEFYTSPSTCYQFLGNSDEFSLDHKNTCGYRVISVHGNTLKTNVVRLK